MVFRNRPDKNDQIREALQSGNTELANILRSGGKNRQKQIQGKLEFANRKRRGLSTDTAFREGENAAQFAQRLGLDFNRFVALNGDSFFFENGVLQSKFKAGDSPILPGLFDPEDTKKRQARAFDRQIAFADRIGVNTTIDPTGQTPGVQASGSQAGISGGSQPNSSEPNLAPASVTGAGIAPQLGTLVPSAPALTGAGTAPAPPNPDIVANTINAFRLANSPQPTIDLQQRQQQAVGGTNPTANGIPIPDLGTQQREAAPVESGASVVPFGEVQIEASQRALAWMERANAGESPPPDVVTDFTRELGGLSSQEMELAGYRQAPNGNWHRGELVNQTLTQAGRRPFYLSSRPSVPARGRGGGVGRGSYISWAGGRGGNGQYYGQLGSSLTNWRIGMSG